MKKKITKYLVATFAILLVLGCGLAYHISSKTKVQEKDPNDETNKVTLTDAELNNQLAYLPNLISKEHFPYSKDISVDKTSDLELLEAAIIYIDRHTDKRIATEESDKFYYKRVDVDDTLQKNYNKSLSDLNINYDKLGFLTFNSEKDAFSIGGSGGMEENLGIIDSCEATEEDLIIMEYAALYSFYSSKKIITDYRTGKKTELSEDEDEKEYFINHKKDYTKYKHIFKKGKTGYYWASTKAVK